MEVNFRILANQFVADLIPYQPGKPIEELERELGITSSIKLASNENPLGPSPLAIASLSDLLQNVHIYPDAGCFDLKQQIAQYHNISPQQITVGNGSENILELIVKAYLHRGDHAVVSEYAFVTIPNLVHSYGASAKFVPAKNWAHDVPAMIKAIDEKTRILFLINPNNPTGTYINDDEFQKLMAAVPPHVLVVVDEAYAEYITCPDYPHAINYLKQYSNLIVSRTFSKIFGLAGLRLGYSISSPEIADILNRARLPFNVNVIAAKAACLALQDTVHIANSIAMNNEGKEQLFSGLQALGCSVIPSLGNFLSVEVGDGMTIYQKLLLEGVIVRPLRAYNMPRHIRVTIGTAAQNERFLAAVHKVK